MRYCQSTGVIESLETPPKKQKTGCRSFLGINVSESPQAVASKQPNHHSYTASLRSSSTQQTLSHVRPSCCGKRHSYLTLVLLPVLRHHHLSRNDRHNLLHLVDLLPRPDQPSHRHRNAPIYPHALPTPRSLRLRPLRQVARLALPILAHSPLSPGLYLQARWRSRRQ